MLKDYQQVVLEGLSQYLNVLKEKKQNTLKFAKILICQLPFVIHKIIGI